ncbi:MAG: hypothetical protein HYZ53_13605 [Planctomycetes bacterium]|nr:hypothetical protein [Planctomycetota bacterium]
MPRFARALMLALVFAVLALAAGAAPVAAQDLSPSQKSALDAQERNLAQWEKEIPGIARTADLDFYQKRFDGALDQLRRNRIPETHPRAVALREKVEALKKLVESRRAGLQAGEAAKAKAADVSNYPDFDNDVNWLETQDKDYSRTQFFDDVDRVGRLVKQFNAVQEEWKKRNEAYQPLIAAAGKHGSFIKNKFEGARRAFVHFHESLNKVLSAAFAELPAAIDQALKLAEQGKAEQKPGFFTGGVRQQMELADTRLKLLAALNDKHEKYVTFSAKYREAQARIEELSSTLKEKILAETQPPQDKYTGADAEELRSAIASEWGKAWPKDEVLAVRMTSEAWKREVSWDETAPGSWKKTDMSFLYARVVVKSSATVATIYVAVVNLDNLTNSRSIGVQTKGGAWVVSEMLAANFK